MPPDPGKLQELLNQLISCFEANSISYSEDWKKNIVVKKRGRGQLRILAFILENVIINGYFTNTSKTEGISLPPSFFIPRS